MKRAIWIVLIVLSAGSCSGKKETGTPSSGNGVATKSGGGSTATVKAGTPAPASDFVVRLNDIGVSIDDYTGNAKTLTIPATIEDLPVVGVSFRSRNPNVEQVYLPEGVIYADLGGSFLNNRRACLPNLRAISLPNTLERINEGGFWYSSNLISVSIPPGVTYIGDDAFRETGIQSIVIPASVTFLGDQAFKDCKNLTSVEISGNNLLIGGDTFHGCENLKNVIINEGVKEIQNNAFRNLKLLETVKLPDSLLYIYDNAFSGCSNLKSVVIPKGVKIISKYAFSGSGVTEVTISKTDEPLTIREGAFSDCENLVTVNFEEGASIKFSQYSQFSDCPKLSLKSQAAIQTIRRDS